MMQTRGPTHFSLYLLERLGIVHPVDITRGQVLEDIIYLHATEAAFCWALRDAAAVSPAYNLAELCALDHRLACHLDGLRQAGDVAWEMCLAELSEDEPGALFAPTVLSVERKDWMGFAKVLDAGAEQPHRARALVSALGFLNVYDLEVLWKGMFAKNAPVPLLFLGLSGHAIHRIDMGSKLAVFCGSEDARLRARALKAVGELCRADMLPALRAAFADDDPACRFWAAWSAILLQDRQARPVLMEIAGMDSPWAERAAAAAAQTMECAEGTRWIEALSGQGASRSALWAAGALGDPAMLPWLVSQCENDETARLAGWAITLITNANIADELGRAAPEDFNAGPTDEAEDEHVAMDPDDDLPWPDIDKLKAWLGDRHFEQGKRHMMGKPIDGGWLWHLLWEGNQWVRAAAAAEQCMRHRGEPLVATRAPGYLQMKRLHAG